MTTYSICLSPLIKMAYRYTIMVYKGEMIVCVYALLTHKTESIYKKMLFQLREAALMIKLELRPDIVS